VDFNNERIVSECDLVFLCILPFQAQQVLKEVRPLATQRSFVFTEVLAATQSYNKTKSIKSNLSQSAMGDRVPPLFASCLSATSVPKLKQLLTDNSVFMRTLIDVPQVKEALFRTKQELHDKMMLSGQ